MLCDRCNINQASLHIEQTINGKAVQADLCAPCAQLLGLAPSAGILEQLLGQGATALSGLIPAISGLSGLAQMSAAAQHGASEGRSCPACGLTYGQFQKTLLFGCPSCYEAFAPHLGESFKRVQAGTRHVGRKPGTLPTPGAMPKSGALPRSENAAGQAAPLMPETAQGEFSADGRNDSVTPQADELAELKQLQAAAVAREDYEKAAQLRDRIKEFTDKQNGPNGPSKQNNRDEQNARAKLNNDKSAQAKPNSDQSAPLNKGQNTQANPDNTSKPQRKRLRKQAQDSQEGRKEGQNDEHTDT